MSRKDKRKQPRAGGGVARASPPAVDAPRAGETLALPGSAPVPPASARAGEYAAASVRVALGALLFYAGYTKFRFPAEFAETLANFRLLPAAGNQVLAVVLPWCEISAGLLLVFGLWTRASGLLALLFFAAFSAAVAYALARGLDIECGCFGTDAAARVGLRALAIDIGGLLAAVVTVRWPRKPGKTAEGY